MYIEKWFPHISLSFSWWTTLYRRLDCCKWKTLYMFLPIKLKLFYNFWDILRLCFWHYVFNALFFLYGYVMPQIIKVLFQRLVFLLLYFLNIFFSRGMAFKQNIFSQSFSIKCYFKYKKSPEPGSEPRSSSLHSVLIVTVPIHIERAKLEYKSDLSRWCDWLTEFHHEGVHISSSSLITNLKSFQNNNNAAVFPIAFHIFMQLVNSWFIRLQG